jgi:hypothetical protein
MSGEIGFESSYLIHGLGFRVSIKPLIEQFKVSDFGLRVSDLISIQGFGGEIGFESSYLIHVAGFQSNH